MLSAATAAAVLVADTPGYLMDLTWVAAETARTG